mmetsp:Transcript_13209/g.43054  ORF Transcript_13209/g.43054 Transcript_13209/m.43054 type:complete len:236 (-) Transcript_13209:301-1008(-)
MPRRPRRLLMLVRAHSPLKRTTPAKSPLSSVRRRWPVGASVGCGVALGPFSLALCPLTCLDPAAEYFYDPPSFSRSRAATFAFEEESWWDPSSAGAAAGGVSSFGLFLSDDDDDSGRASSEAGSRQERPWKVGRPMVKAEVVGMPVQPLEPPPVRRRSPSSSSLSLRRPRLPRSMVVCSSSSAYSARTWASVRPPGSDLCRSLWGRRRRATLGNERSNARVSSMDFPSVSSSSDP